MSFIVSVKPDIDFNSSTGNGSVIVITVGDNSTNGTVIIKINGTEFNATVVNGTAIINLTNVTPGDHNATVIYIDGNNNTFEYNATISIPKWKSSINATGINIVEGYDEIVTVNVTPGNATGIVMISIGERGFYANVTDGVAKVILSGLKAGEYNDIVVRYSGDDIYNESFTTVSFIVSPKPDIDYNASTGNGSVIVITVGDNSTNGTIQIIIDNVTYNGTVVNGTAIVNLTNVTPGDHNATIIYTDGNNNTFEYNTIISVPKWDAEIAANATNIRQGDIEVITIEIKPVNATGVVLVDIAGKGYYVNINNGKATLEVENLKEGSYTAYVTYLGNDYYNNATTTAAFKVSEGININTNGTGNRTDLVIDIPENATGGNITVIIDNKTYNVTNVTGSPVVIPLDNLTPGEHNVTVIYVDGNGTTSVVNDTITVSLYDTPITIEVNNTLAGDTTKVVVTVPVGIDGNIQIDIDGATYTEKANNGKAIFNIDGLLAGNKTVTAIYAGDNVYAFNATVAKFNVTKRPAPISVTVDNSTAGKVIVSVELPADATGYVIVNVKGVDFGINLTAGEKSATIPIKVGGNFTADVTYLGDNKYMSNATSSKFQATGIDPSQEFAVEVNNTLSGEDVIVKVTLPENATGNVTVKIDNETKVITNVTGGDNYIAISNVSDGSHEVEVIYSGDEDYNSRTVVEYITVFKSIVAEENMTRGWNSPYDFKAEFLDKEGYVLTNTEIIYTINGKQYKVMTDEQGIAYLTVKLAVGKYDVEIYNPVTGENVTRKLTIVARIIENKDLTMEYEDGSKYVVRAVGDDGKPVGAGEVVRISVNGKNYAPLTDSKGYAYIVIHLAPKKYTITAQYRTYKVSNKLKVKSTIKLVKKTVKVKKGKKIVLKAKLKWANGKAIKSKKVTFKFRSKTYSAKTNKKGIAKVTIKKKKVLKKLKKGKKYKFTAKYIKEKAKGKVKIKK